MCVYFAIRCGFCEGYYYTCVTYAYSYHCLSDSLPVPPSNCGNAMWSFKVTSKMRDLSASLISLTIPTLQTFLQKIVPVTARMAPPFFSYC